MQLDQQQDEQRRGLEPDGRARERHRERRGHCQPAEDLHGGGVTVGHRTEYQRGNERRDGRGRGLLENRRLAFALAGELGAASPFSRPAGMGEGAKEGAIVAA